MLASQGEWTQALLEVLGAVAGLEGKDYDP